MEQQKAKPVISDLKYQSKPKRVFHMLLPQLIMGAILLVVIIVVVAVIQIHRDNEPRTGVCSTSLITESLTNMTSNNLSSLANNVSTIKGLAHYQHDPNCMYIVTSYYVDTLNTMQAQSSLKLFNAAYNGHNLNAKLSKYASARALSVFVTNLTERTQQAQQNFNSLQGQSISGTKKK